MNEAEQIILNHLTDQLKKSYTEAIDRLHDKLAEVILNLQSDEVLNQMRNDPTLHEFKLTRVKELLSDVMSSERQIVTLTRTVAELKNSLFVAEVESTKQIQMFKLKEQQHFESLEDIENKFSQYRREIQEQAFSNKKQLRELINIHSGCELKVSSLEGKVQNYESIIRTMQNDMVIVKSRWQQRCREVEDELKKKLKSDISQLERQYQNKIEALMQEYNRCSEDGKTMVVQTDEQLLASMRKQLKQLRSRCAQAEVVKEEHIRELELMGRQNSQYKECMVEQRERQSRMAIQLKSIQQKYQENLRTYEEKNDQCRRLNKQLSVIRREADQLRNEVQRQQKLRHELEQDQLKELQYLRDKCQMSSEDDRQRQNSELVAAKEVIRQRNADLQQLELQIQALQKIQNRLKQQLNNRDHTIIEQETRINTDRIKFKSMKEHQRKLVKAIENCRLPIQRLRNENDLLKQQIKYDLQVYKRKLQSELMTIFDRVVLLRDKFEQQSTQKMLQLLAEVEKTSRRDASQLQKANNDNQLIRARLMEYQIAFQQKLVEINQGVRTKDHNSIKLAEQLQRAKNTIERLESEKETIFSQWEREIRQFKKDIINTIRSHKQSANQDLHDIITDQLRLKEKQVDKIKAESRQKEDFIEELEKKLQIVRAREDDLKQRMSELQVLRNRCHLEEQTRRKLQKELKETRLDLLCKEGVINQLTKVKRDKQNISKNLKDQKQRELEQIRAMIVKTYQVVGGRQQDTPERGNKRVK